MYSVVRKRPPSAQFDWELLRGGGGGWLVRNMDDEVELVGVNVILGPLYRVTTNAPNIENIVPNTLALVLELVNSSFSILPYISFQGNQKKKKVILLNYEIWPILCIESLLVFVLKLGQQ